MINTGKPLEDWIRTIIATNVAYMGELEDLLELAKDLVSKLELEEPVTVLAAARLKGRFGKPGLVKFLVKQSVFNSFHVRVLDKAYDGILGLELHHKDTDTSIAMFTCYLPPENSPWGRDADSFFRIY